MAAAKPAADEAARSIVTTRLIDAPRELVFEAWTKAERLAAWWGPNGFTTTTSAFDFRPGGVWRFIMHGPDGRDYENSIRFDEIKPPELLRYSHGGGGDFEHVQFKNTITFEAEGEKTRITMRAVFHSVDMRDRVVRENNAEEGGRQTIARLAVYVATKALERGGAEVFEISRWFEAPRELLWKVMSDAEHLAHWWGPAGFAMEKCTIDFRVGGKFHYGMRGPDGKYVMWGRFIYHEITPPSRQVYVVSFSDAEGGVTRAPFAEEWPLEMLNIVEFEEEAGGTLMSIKSCAFDANAAERATFKKGFASMQNGFTGTYDQLETYLKTLKGGAS